MERCPFHYEAQRPRGKLAARNSEGAYLDRRFVVLIDRMEVRRRVVPKMHPYDNAVEP